MEHTKWILLSILFLALCGCGEDDEITHSITVNAYIRGMMIDGKANYAPILVAENDDTPNSMTATDNNGGQYNLENYWEYSLRYRWVPKVKNYTANIKNLTVNFLAKYSDGKEIKESVETKMSNVPKSFTITSLDYDASSKQKFSVIWTNAKADYYLISISKNLDDSPIFQSLNISIDGNNADEITTTFDRSTMKWYASPTNGEEYLLNVHAFNLANNSEVIGEFIASKKFTWGE